MAERSAANTVECLKWRVRRDLNPKREHGMRAAGQWDEARQHTADTICAYCGVGCTLTLHVQDNRIVKVTSPADNSVTHGHLCIKGRFGFTFVEGPGSG